jgi:hypothetical protein
MLDYKYELHAIMVFFKRHDVFAEINPELQGFNAEFIKFNENIEDE